MVEINKTEQTKNQKFEFVSLTGETVNGENFKHNNMQPFFGSKIKGKSGYESHEGILDGLGGVGSQQFKKQERAPLFKPSGDSKFINGAPNMNDFLCQELIQVFDKRIQNHGKRNELLLD